MIEFLIGAFSVLGVRADKIVRTLEDKRDFTTQNRKQNLPPSALEHCRRVSARTRGVIDLIDNRRDILQQLREALQTNQITSSQSDAFLKQVFKSYRDSRREIDAIEENFVGHLIRFNEADLFYTNLASALWKDTNLPDTPPIAVTNTSGYFCTWAALGIVFSPPSSEHHLLISPDLYHEFGHILQAMKVELFGQRFLSELKSHITQLENKVRRTARPIKEERILDIAFRWNSSWAEEVACDTMATLMLGASYGWCNLQLCLQSSNVFDGGGKHPSDAARTKHILNVLRRCGFNDDAEKIENLWNQYLRISQQTISKYYDDYHPDSLFTAVMEDVEQAIKDNNFGITNKSATIEILDEAWKQFLENTSSFDQWEKTAVIGLKKSFTNHKVNKK